MLTGQARRGDSFATDDVAEIIVIPRKEAQVDVLAMDNEAMIRHGISVFGLRYIDVRSYGQTIRIHIGASETFGTDLFFTTGSERYVKLVMLHLRLKGWIYHAGDRGFMVGKELRRFESEREFFREAGLLNTKPYIRRVDNLQVAAFYEKVIGDLQVLDGLEKNQAAFSKEEV